MATSVAVEASSSPCWSSVVNSSIENADSASSRASPVAMNVRSIDTIESSTCFGSESIFPNDLQQILSQVSQSGKCTHLPWKKYGSITLMEKFKTNFINNGRNTLTRRNSLKRSHDDLNHNIFSPSRKYTSECNSSPNKRRKAENGDTHIASHHWTYHSLREALGHALLLVLDKSYNKVGYIISPSEKKRLSISEKSATANAECASDVFQSRKKQLLGMLVGIAYQRDEHEQHGNRKAFASNASTMPSSSSSSIDKLSHHYFSSSRNENDQIIEAQGRMSEEEEERYESDNEIENPPFTIQRFAEILYMSEQYYTQTHKLCNALEKLLLTFTSDNFRVTSSSTHGRNDFDVSQHSQHQQAKSRTSSNSTVFQNTINTLENSTVSSPANRQEFSLDVAGDNNRVDQNASPMLQSETVQGDRNHPTQHLSASMLSDGFSRASATQENITLQQHLSLNHIAWDTTGLEGPNNSKQISPMAGTIGKHPSLYVMYL